MKKTPAPTDTVKKYSLEIEVPYVETDPNQMFRLAWRGRKGKFDRIKTSIQALTAGKRPAKPLEKFKISITRRATAYLDWDNLVASLKPAIDALKMSGIIIDDGWGYIRHVDVDQEKTKKGVKKSILIRVEEL